MNISIRTEVKDRKLDFVDRYDDINEIFAVLYRIIIFSNQSSRKQSQIVIVRHSNFSSEYLSSLSFDCKLNIKNAFIIKGYLP